MRENSIKDSGHYRPVNLCGGERLISAAGGVALSLFGLRRGGFSGLLIGAIGGAMIYRGATGHCALYKSLSVSTVKRKGLRASVKHGAGIKIEESVTINRPVEDLFRYWSDVEKLPCFLNHLESVRAISGKSGKLSHWVARLPAGLKVEWDAEIIKETPNELIAWRSLEGAEVPNAGSVRFARSPNGNGSEIKIAIEYAPPAGKIGSIIGKLLGENPDRRIVDDLRRFKRFMEGGRGQSPSNYKIPS